MLALTIPLLAAAIGWIWKRNTVPSMRNRPARRRTGTRGESSRSPS
jgi:hypothetical protein